MTTPIRFAIWAAVSTEAQATGDKYSLTEQQTSCRNAGLAHGWIETSGPYIVPGESRTRYVNLSDAERAIPPLRQLLDDAQAKLFDILIIYEFDRLRELLDPIARTLSHYGCQLYSVSQPLEPQPPHQYNPYATDTEFMLRGMNAIISRAAISNLRRKFQTQMPRRILERRIPHMIPYGYKKPTGHETDRGAIPVQNPETAPHLLLMKDWLLAGKSANQIAAEMNDLHIPPPASGKRKRPITQWHPSSIISILTNPFYAGWVRWGRSKSQLDPRTGQSHRTYTDDPQHLVTARGHHTPIWDDATHTAILNEIARRTTTYRTWVHTALTELLHCSICGATLWRDLRGRGPNRRTAWKCSKGLAAHMVVDNLIVLRNLAAHLTRELTLPADTPQTTLTTLEKQILELKTIHTRIGDGYLSGLFSLEESTRRGLEITRQITALEEKHRIQQTASAKTALRQQTLDALRPYHPILPAYFEQADPQELHKILLRLYTSITINPAGEIISTTPNNS